MTVDTAVGVACHVYHAFFVVWCFFSSYEQFVFFRGRSEAQSAVTSRGCWSIRRAGFASPSIRNGQQYSFAPVREALQQRFGRCKGVREGCSEGGVRKVAMVFCLSHRCERSSGVTVEA
ncbi:unnamed protein product, partial [Ectocarpus sp. 12 AP-2014]